MQENHHRYNNEIDLLELFKSFLDKKISILLILISSIVIGFFYNSQQPILFKNSLNIQESKSTEFTNFLPLYNYLYDDLINPTKGRDKEKNILVKRNNISDLMLDRFLNELMDLEELVLILSNNEKIKNDILELSLDEKKKILYEYAKMLTIDQPIKDESNYIITFIWHDFEEAKNILKTLFNSVSDNLEKRIFKELNELTEIKKKKLLIEI